MREDQEASSPHWGWLRSAALLSLGASAGVVLLVRVASLGSQGLMTSRFGAGTALDAFFIALIIPGLVVSPLTAAIEAAVAPSVVRLLGRDRERVAAFSRRVLVVAALGGAVLALVVTALSPVLILFSAPGTSGARLHLARHLALILYPSVFPRLVTAAAAGVLYGRGRLHAPLVIQGVNPAIIIVALVLWSGHHPDVLAWAATAGWFLEAALVVGYLLRHGGVSSADAGEEYKVALAMLGPLAVTFLVVQAGPILDQVFAATLGAGGLATFVLAARLFDAVVGMLLIPNARLAQNRVASAMQTGTDALRRAVRAEAIRSFAVGAAAAAVLAVGAPMIVYGVYHHGAFTNADARTTITVAEVFALALVPLAVGFVMPRMLIELHHKRVLFRLMAAQLALNVLLDALLIGPLDGPGLALSSVGAYAVVAVAECVVVFRVVASSVPPAVAPELEHEERPQRGRGGVATTEQLLEQPTDG